MLLPGTFLGEPDFITWIHDWIPIIFMGLLVVLVFMTMRLVPRTKPAEIRPETTPPIAWDDIAGAEEAKAELREIVDYMRDAKRFRTLGAHLPAGILLHGPPGTGKTLLAKAVAHESGASFFSQSASSFVEMFAGLGSARIRRLFKEARKHAPAIIFIDELDAVGTARSGGAANREYDHVAASVISGDSVLRLLMPDGGTPDRATDGAPGDSGSSDGGTDPAWWPDRGDQPTDQTDGGTGLFVAWPGTDVFNPDGDRRVFDDASLA